MRSSQQLLVMIAQFMIVVFMIVVFMSAIDRRTRLPWLSSSGFAEPAW